MWNIDDFQFDLDESLIAKYPKKERDESKLMILNRKENQVISESSFTSILNYLTPGDTLVFNNTKVSKRRMYLLTENRRIHEVVFLEISAYPKKNSWYCLVRNSSKLKMGEKLIDLSGKYEFIYERGTSGRSYLTPSLDINEEIFDQIGTVPIPPYLKRRSEEIDEVRYQTIFAKVPGSVASPTAGLHFTDKLKSMLTQKGIEIVEITLTVGYGTFAPLEQNQLESKKLHPEEFTISTEVANKLNMNRKKGRIISIGTTTLRALESSFDKDSNSYISKTDKTTLFLGPGDTIKSIDGLLTNFHLPKSSLMFLVAAFAGKDFIMSSYLKAIQERFRFFSYGDAMLIL
jgi:S-adenosylmethionine:tRNA ribosyltransferase-isomerase